MRCPISTYRLQLNGGFTFADAMGVLSYLNELGVDALYLSPILTAVAGSTHGYDVVDHSRVSEELGGRDGFVRLADAAHDRGMGVVVDLVPNHMGIPPDLWSNRALWSALRDGAASPYALWFDIVGGPMAFPDLPAPLDEVLGDGRLRRHRATPPGEQSDQWVWTLGERHYPIAPGTENLPPAECLAAQHYRIIQDAGFSTPLHYRRFFAVTNLIGLRQEIPEVFDATHAVLLDLVGEGHIDGLRVDHPDGLVDPQGYLDRLASRAKRRVGVKARWDEGNLGPEGTGRGAGGSDVWIVAEKILSTDETLPPSWPVDGTTGYESSWRVDGLFIDPCGADTLTGLARGAGEPPTWADVCATAKRQIADTLFTTDVDRLVSLVRRAVAGDVSVGENRKEIIEAASDSQTRLCVRELIVGLDRYRAYVRPDGLGLPGDGRGDGSSGLVFGESLRDANGPDEPSPEIESGADVGTVRLAQPLNVTNQRNQARGTVPIDPIEAKGVELARTSEPIEGLSSDGTIDPIEARGVELARTSEPIEGLSLSGGEGGDGSSGLVFLDSCVECHGPDEPSPGPASREDLAVLGEACERARGNVPGELHPVLEAVRGLVAGEGKGEAADELAIRFQQVCSAVMAKGVEDTAGYRWTPLVSLCEVGGDPSRIGYPPDELHAWFARQARDWPASMTGSSTHDAKRSDDVRARIGVIAEYADEWAALVARLAPLAQGIDPLTAQFMWQTLAGTWDEAGLLPMDRLQAYLLKAIREQDRWTNWYTPDLDAERAFTRQVEAIVAHPETQDAFAGWVRLTAESVRAALLGAVAIRWTAPGVPDTYQGCETSRPLLTDPDNRRAVDFSALRGALGAVEGVLSEGGNGDGCQGSSGRSDGDGGEDGCRGDGSFGLVVPESLRESYGPNEPSPRPGEPLPGPNEPSPVEPSPRSLAAEKLFLVHTLARVRRRGPAGPQVYRPLTTPNEHLWGFAYEGRLTLVSRRTRTLRDGGGWGDAAVELPPGVWTNVVTGRTHTVWTRVADLLTGWPCAVLVPFR